MNRIPSTNFKNLERVLVKLGFAAVRQKGSHVFYRHPDGRTTTVPKYPGRDLARPLVREILHEIQIGVEEFQRLLKE